jgi:hypothetical protein
MSVWDVFTGKKSSKPSTETIASTPTTNFSSAPFDPLLHKMFLHFSEAHPFLMPRNYTL